VPCDVDEALCGHRQRQGEGEEEWLRPLKSGSRLYQLSAMARAPKEDGKLLTEGQK
jgi:hypothetical protein